MRYIKIIVIIFVCFFGYIVYLSIQLKNKEYALSLYDKELISYFKEIALQSEYSDNPEKVVKWKDPMILFVNKQGENKPQMLIIKKTIDKINQLSTDGFKIVLTNNFSKCNSVLFLCNKEKLNELAPFFYDIVTDGIDYNISGYSYSEFDTNTYIIDRSLIYINTEEPLDTQESVILEEITQSIGLSFDSKKYPNSIFFQNKSEQKVKVKKYSKLDSEIIRILYHPYIKPGMNTREIEQAIIKTLKS